MSFFKTLIKDNSHYISLGCGKSLVTFFFEQTEVSTIICDRKQYNKLVAVSKELGGVKRVVVMEDAEDSSEIVCPSSMNWTVASLTKVQELGKEKPSQANLPTSSDVAVIMYTSGSTGLPKVKSLTDLLNIKGQLSKLHPHTY